MSANEVGPQTLQAWRSQISQRTATLAEEADCFVDPSGDVSLSLGLCLWLQFLFYAILYVLAYVSKIGSSENFDFLG